MNAHAGLNDVLKEVSEAKGLPNAHYVDQGVFEEERRHVLFANWAGVGFGKDVPETGDAKPVDFLGMPLLLVRDEDGEVNVYQNTCRHRGMILVEEPQKIQGAIRCPYHSWCYTLKGALRTTPHVGGPGNNIHDDIKRDELGLFRVRAHVWQDVVFVNIDGNAAPFEEVHEDLLERWSEFERPIYHGGPDASFKLKVKTNWKLAVENYCESYHLPWIHPGLNSYSRLEDHYHIEADGPFCGQGVTIYNPSLSEDGRSFPSFADQNPKWQGAAEYPMFFPNIMIGVQNDHLWGFIVEPISHDRSREHVQIFYTDESVAGDEFADMRKKNAEMWAEVFAEDIFVVEGMQKGRHASHFDGGKFSPVMDNPTHDFHVWVAEQMQA